VDGSATFFQLANRKALEIDRMCQLGIALLKNEDHALLQHGIAVWWKSYRTALNRYCDQSGEGATLVWREMGIYPGSPALYFWLQYLSFTFREVDDLILNCFPQARLRALFGNGKSIIPNELIFFASCQNELPKGWIEIPPFRPLRFLASGYLSSGICDFCCPFGCRFWPSNKLYHCNHSQSSFAILEFKVYPLDVD